MNMAFSARLTMMDYVAGHLPRDNFPESPTQTSADAQLQVRTQRVCGKGARQAGGGFSPIPSVKAFSGPLPNTERGIEFVTSLAPSYEQPFVGGLCQWRPKDPGVTLHNGGDLACIPVTITRVNQ